MCMPGITSRQTLPCRGLYGTGETLSANFWTGFRTPFWGHPQESVLLEGRKWSGIYLFWNKDCQDFSPPFNVVARFFWGGTGASKTLAATENLAPWTTFSVFIGSVSALWFGRCCPLLVFRLFFPVTDSDKLTKAHETKKSYGLADADELVCFDSSG